MRRIGQRFNPYKAFEAGIYIPEQLCRYPGMSHGAKLVWGRLKRYCGQDGNAYPSLSHLGKEVALSKDQARQYVRELQRHRLIEVDNANKHYYSNGGGGTPRYYFLWHACFEDQKEHAPLVDSQGVPLAKTPAPTAGESASQRESLVKRADTRKAKERPPINIWSGSSYGSFDEPLGWKQERELRRLEGNLPLEEMEKLAKAEAGSRRHKWTRILAKRLSPLAAK